MTTETSSWPVGRVLALIGLLLYIVTGIFPYAASGLLVPFWGIVVLWAGWLVGLWVTFQMFQRRSAWALAMQVVAVAFWLLVVNLGESFFGWTA